MRQRLDPKALAQYHEIQGFGFGVMRGAVLHTPRAALNKLPTLKTRTKTKNISHSEVLCAKFNTQALQ